MTGTDAVDLYWLPVGAGDASPWVRRGSRAYESVVARLKRRPACDLLHFARLNEAGCYASSIARPDLPITSVATLLSLSPASSRTRCKRLTSRVRSRI